MLKNLPVYAAVIVAAVLSCATVVDDAHASHKAAATSQPCSVTARGQTFPVEYGGAPRANPDGSLYPGDSFYFLVKFSASPTCLGLDVAPLRSYDGIDLEFHNITAWSHVDAARWQYNTGGGGGGAGGYRPVTVYADPSEAGRVHSHQDQSRRPASLETVHYYAAYGDGRHLFSIREDVQPTRWQDRIISRGGLYTTNSTHEWDFVARSSPSHPHPAVVCTPGMLADSNAVRHRGVLAPGSPHGGGLGGTEVHECRIPDRYADPGSLGSFHDVVRARCSSIQLYSGCIYGKATVNAGSTEPVCLHGELARMGVARAEFPDRDKCVNLVQRVEQKVTGFKQSCTETARGTVSCRSVPVTRTVEFEPSILAPRLGLDLAKLVLRDPDGYDARNGDGTYYVWDPVAVTYKPVLEWKDDRANTVRFEVSPTGWGTLHARDRTACPSPKPCIAETGLPGFSPSGWTLGNGDGIDVYNATGEQHEGVHRIAYSVQAYNAGVRLLSAGGAATAATAAVDAEVVPYNPVYAAHPYALLSDDRRTAYENRASVALRYAGSAGDDGGDGGNGTGVTVHTDRRSKLNGFAYAGVAFDPWLPVVMDDILSWSGVGPVPDPAPDHRIRTNAAAAGGGADGGGGGGESACVAGAPGTAMMTRAGYCRIHFEYPVIGTVVGPAGPVYENVTIFNTLLSRDFAGSRATVLAHYEYAFSEALFRSNLEVRSVGPGGAPNPVPLSVRVGPGGIGGGGGSGVANATGAITVTAVDEYLYEKTLHDTGDEGFARIVAGDVYPVRYAAASDDDGVLDIPLRRVASAFPVYGGDGGGGGGIRPDPYGTDGIGNLSAAASRYAGDPGGARLGTPVSVGLGTLSPVRVSVTAGDQTRLYDYPYENFGTDRRITVNVAQDNPLFVDMYAGGTIVAVTAEPGFGDIAELYLNGSLVNNATCVAASCTANLPPTPPTPPSGHRVLDVTAVNVWGGTAHAAFDAANTVEGPGAGDGNTTGRTAGSAVRSLAPPPTSALDPMPAGLTAALLLGVPAWWAYRRIRGR